MTFLRVGRGLRSEESFARSLVRIKGAAKYYKEVGAM